MPITSAHHYFSKSFQYYLYCGTSSLSFWTVQEKWFNAHRHTHTHTKNLQRTLRNHEEILNWSEVGPAPWMESSRVAFWSELLSCGYSNLHLSFTLETSIYNLSCYPLLLFCMTHSVYHASSVVLCRSKWIMFSWSSICMTSHKCHQHYGVQFQSVLFGSQIYLQVFIKTRRILENFIIY